MVPGRPVKYVQKHVKRLYDPRGNKGAWSVEEDNALLRYVQFHPTDGALKVD